MKIAILRKGRANLESIQAAAHAQRSACLKWRSVVLRIHWTSCFRCHRKTQLKSRDVLGDFWGTPVQYSITNGTHGLRSAGPDKKLGTQDDLVIMKTGV